jgi:hypothetical protein
MFGMFWLEITESGRMPFNNPILFDMLDVEKLLAKSFIK